MITRGTRTGTLLGAIAGGLMATAGSAVHPAGVVVAGAALGAAIGIRRGRPSLSDVFLLRILLATCIGVVAVTGAGILGAVPSILVALIAGVIMVGATRDLIRFSFAAKRFARLRARKRSASGYR